MNRREAIDEVRAKFSGLPDYLQGGYLHKKKQKHPVDMLDECNDSEAVVKCIEGLEALEGWLNKLEEIELKKENDALPAEPFAGANTGE